MASGVAVLHPQDVFHQKYHKSSFISPATRSGRRITNVTNFAGTNPSAPAVNILNPSHSRRSSRKKSPTKKDAFPKKEFTASKPKPKSEARSITSSSHSNLVMGQVKILKRGEILPSSPATPPSVKSPPASNKASRVNTVEELLVFSPQTPSTPSDRMMGLPAERDLLRKQIRFPGRDCYAGSAIDVSSPPPSSLPVPAFFKKKLENSSSGATSGTTVDATNDLLKLLRLDLS